MPTATATPAVPSGDKVCLEAGMKPEFYSSIGNDYCVSVCVGSKQRVCNLYLCWCRTE